MNETNYKAVLTETIAKLATINSERGKLEVEAAKLRQFFFATLNMLPDNERSQFIADFREINAKLTLTESSLKNAIYNILSQASPKFLTAAEVRDHLRMKEFDFSKYTSNELASVSTTLRRFKPQEVEVTNIEGVAAYRLKGRRLVSAFRQAKKRTLAERIQDFEDSAKKK